MWIVKNKLRGTLVLRGLGIQIPAGDEFDLDAIGRDTAEGSPQVAVAFEEGYLSNVFKQPGGAGAPGAPQAAPKDLLTSRELQDRLDDFKHTFLDQLKRELPQLGKLETLEPGSKLDLKAELESVRKAIAQDVREVVAEVQQAKERIETEKRRVLADASLSTSEIKARLSFLEEKERELERNFETVGRTVENQDGDVMDKADILANL